MAPVHKLSRSGYMISEVYIELESALLAGDDGRACGLTAELACTAGGQTRSVVTFLINSYCTRRLNSGRSQMSLLRSCLAHMGDGSPHSPGLDACNDPMYRKGLCTLTLLVASGARGGRDVTAAFANVPRVESIPTLALTIEALREATVGGDARRMSSILRAVPDEAWCSGVLARGDRMDRLGLGHGMPDVQRLRAVHRRDPVWDVWRLAQDLAEERGVSEFVGDCLHAFAWGFGVTVRRTRIHLLWYAFLVIIKGAPRAGPHPVEPGFFEQALASIDTVFTDVLGAEATRHEPVPTKTKAVTRAEAEAIASSELDARTAYLLTVTKADPGRVWEVERDRETASIGRRLGDDGESMTKSVVLTTGHLLVSRKSREKRERQVLGP